MENQKYGIQETIDVVDFVTSLGNAVDSSLSDGKINLMDITKFWDTFGVASDAFKGLKEIPKELGDLDEQEAQAVKDRFQEGLKIDNPAIENVAVKGFVVSVALAEFIVAIRDARSSTATTIVA